MNNIINKSCKEVVGANKISTMYCTRFLVVVFLFMNLKYSNVRKILIILHTPPPTPPPQKKNLTLIPTGTRYGYSLKQLNDWLNYCLLFGQRQRFLPCEQYYCNFAVNNTWEWVNVSLLNVVITPKSTFVGHSNDIILKSSQLVSYYNTIGQK